MDATFVDGWRAICQELGGAFTVPTCSTFLQIATGWVLCRSKPKVTSLVCTIGGSLLGHAAKHWTVYERFFYRASWSLDSVSELLLKRVVVPLIDRFGSDGRGAPVALVLDGTTCGRSGKHVAYAGYYKDASVTNVTRTVVHWAHRWLIGAIVLRPASWRNWAVALPVFFALHRKEADCDRETPFLSVQDQAAAMIQRAQEALPGRKIQVVADGEFATGKVVAALDERSSLISRIRRDAALHAPLPKRQRRQPGRPRTKGRRLPTPAQMSRCKTGWKTIRIRRGGRIVSCRAKSVVCLWPYVCGQQLVNVVVVRNRRRRDDEYFVCTDPTVSDTRIVEAYYARWTIEEVIQDGKQLDGFESVQGWCRRTVERQAPMALIVQTLVKAWYVIRGHRATAAHPKGSEVCGWRSPKDHPSYLDMLATLRRVLWEHRINTKSRFRGLMRETLNALHFTLSAAA